MRLKEDAESGRIVGGSSTSQTSQAVQNLMPSLMIPRTLEMRPNGQARAAAVAGAEPVGCPRDFPALGALQASQPLAAFQNIPRFPL
ncbi:hypothetical protein JX265_000319 [Neoarthrinium moseri]|uniref:Uncharacterized protein n=1 Tax=Neoarthrinium moseri TaxID=1658444 RepID=A0A9Q0AUT1_9PEZI|nr:uncharacterized protein JN550_000569 [Neoarthrinium moseri]KAI1878387.1 hypothetical protein JN550_000569 [Neoarthrinium moseri]KAI1881493.1 hypothetical protein JX265_000319 [Neoarthrinium moseri]